MRLSVPVDRKEGKARQEGDQGRLSSETHEEGVVPPPLRRSVPHGVGHQNRANRSPIAGSPMAADGGSEWRR